MTSEENRLALKLIRENYGELPSTIVQYIITKRSCSFMAIVDDLKLERKLVSKVLTNLIVHNLIDYELNQRQIVQYKLNMNNTLRLVRMPKYLLIAKSMYGLNGELIMEELALHGYLEMSSVLIKIMWRKFDANELKVNTTVLDTELASVRDTFQSMVEDEFIEKCDRLAFDPDADDTCSSKQQPSKIPVFIKQNDYENRLVPVIRFTEELKRKLLQDDCHLLASNIRAPNEDFGDNYVYWRINMYKLHQICRDQAIVDSIRNRLDETAANIMEAILKLANGKIKSDKATASDLISNQITSIDIQKVLRNNYQMDSIMTEKYLSVITQENFKVLEKVGDFSGGAYSVDYKRASTQISLAHIESYVRERFGSRSLRIFKVILEKSQIEQKQIEDLSMIPSKECKALVYDMLKDGILNITELSKASDHASSRTFYLFNIDTYHIAKKLLSNGYKAMSNLMQKREHLVAENKRLLEKNIKTNAIVESLIIQNADQAEIDDVKSMMSSEELESLSKITDRCNKIEMAELQLEETLFTFENYFYYNTIEPVITSKRSVIG